RAFTQKISWLSGYANTRSARTRHWPRTLGRPSLWQRFLSLQCERQTSFTGIMSVGSHVVFLVPNFQATLERYWMATVGGPNKPKPPRQMPTRLERKKSPKSPIGAHDCGCPFSRLRFRP